MAGGHAMRGPRHGGGHMMRGGGVRIGGHHAPRFHAARGGGPRHVGRSMKFSRPHAGRPAHVGREALRGQAFHGRGARGFDRPSFARGNAPGVSRREMRQALRSAPVHARGNPFAARAFSGRNAQAFAARAFAPGFARHRFDPAFFHRTRFAGAFWPGPSFWPYAYYDETFWLWPSAYDSVFWNYGYDDLLYGIYRPYDYDFGRAFGAPGRRASTAQPASANFAEWCGSTAPGLTDWPVDDIAAAVEPTPEQRALLEDLIRVSDKAAQELRAACPRTRAGHAHRAARNARAAARGVAQRGGYACVLRWRNSMLVVRRAEGALQRAWSEDHPRDGAAPRTEMRSLTGSHRPAARAAIPHTGRSTRIDDVVQPNDAQRAALGELRAATEKAAEIVRSACPTGSALTPTGRLAGNGAARWSPAGCARNAAACAHEVLREPQ